MKLYHATFSKLARKIKKAGYLGNSPYKMWSDSQNKYVYLAVSEDIAYSYAETCLDELENERLYDMLEDDEIVIFEVDTKDLDLSKLKKDANVIDGNATYQYEGTIPYNVLKVVDYRESINEVLEAAGIQ